MDVPTTTVTTADYYRKHARDETYTTAERYNNYENCINHLVNELLELRRSAKQMADEADAARQQALELSKLRDAACEECFNSYTFHREVVAMDGWQYTEPGTSRSRKVYLRNYPSSAPSICVTYVVVFKAEDSARVESDYMEYTP